MNSKFFIIILALALLSALGASAQVTIGSLTEPNATLDVRKVSPTPAAAPSGIIAPNISGTDLKADDAKYAAPQRGAIVYATSASPDAAVTGAKTRKVTAAGYYYFDGAIWQAFGSADDAWFYMPTLPLSIDPNDADGGGVFTVDLHQKYYDQFGTPAAKSVTTSTLPAVAEGELEFYVTYYDAAFFSDVAVSAAGVLTYKLVSGGAVTDKTFMNVVFKRK
jgi:hypothetical protein